MDAGIYFIRALASQFFGHSPMVSFCRGSGECECVSKPGGRGLSPGEARVVSPGHGSQAATY
jgi:hypothetical protein